MGRPPVAAPSNGIQGGRRVDLHTHTHFSDGLLAPEALVSFAIERQLAVLAITWRYAPHPRPVSRSS